MYSITQGYDFNIDVVLKKRERVKHHNNNNSSLLHFSV